MAPNPPGSVMTRDDRPGESRHLTRVAHSVATTERERQNGHRGGVLWLTGLSGAGKSTLAFALESELFARGYQVYVLDGDNVRHGLNSDLGFTHRERTENIRRMGEVAALFADAGFVCISAFISPYRADREAARAAAKGRFHEVYLDADVETCERRDPKGLYRKARAGKIREFTGVSAPYEIPTSPDLVIPTGSTDIASSLALVVSYVEAEFCVLTPP